MDVVFGQLSKGFKRLTTPSQLNPDGSVPPPLTGAAKALAPRPFEWWDEMRYLVRGRLRARINRLDASIYLSFTPQRRPHEPCVQVLFGSLGATSSEGRIEISGRHMSARAHVGVPDAGPDEPLLAIPLLWLPGLSSTMNFSWKLPGGRPAAGECCRCTASTRICRAPAGADRVCMLLSAGSTARPDRSQTLAPVTGAANQTVALFCIIWSCPDQVVTP